MIAIERSVKTNRLKNLTNILDLASHIYYQENREMMSNYDYDKKLEELRSLEEELGLVLNNSPTHKVGYEIKSKLEKVKHSKSMLSLQKTKNVEEIIKFLGNEDAILSWKEDGLTVILKYDKGVLQQAITRGNGEEGENVTHNAKMIRNIPKQIPIQDYIEIRGEGLISYVMFEKINEQIKNEDDKYKNPRNLASGSIRQLDSKISEERRVQFLAFELVNWQDFKLKSKQQSLYFLSDLGFMTVERIKVNKHNIKTAIEVFTNKSKSHSTPVDGLVIELDKLEYGKSLGTTSNHPLNAIAFKWKDKPKETTLIDVIWQTSRTGAINPVGIFETVEIYDTEVERASLFNVTQFNVLKLKKRDKIGVIKANMIIPQIVENYDIDKEGELIKIPDTCPSCGLPTTIMNTGKAEVLMCYNKLCGAQIVSSIAHYCSRNALNIEGLSEKTIEKFLAFGIIEDLQDIYYLHEKKDIIIKMDGFGEKSYQKIVDAVEKSRKTKLNKFIYGLGIPLIGKSASEELCEHFHNDLELIFSADKEQIMEIDGFGEAMGSSIKKYFSTYDTQWQVTALREELEFEKIEEIENEKSLKDKVFVVTGKVYEYKNRDELKAEITSLGGKVAGSVSKKTNYLINNDTTSTSGKNQKAQKLNIPIISEKEFLEMIGK